MTPKVSVLVPLYNSEKHIEKCVKSIISQSFNSFEILLIDDYSSDNSFNRANNILSEKQDLSYKIVQNTKNRGIAYCRNQLLSMASGKYILFVDSDDWIESNTLEALYIAAESEEAEIVVADFFIEIKNRTTIAYDHISCDKNENIKNIIDQKKAYPSLWNKLILKTLFDFNNCTFDDNLNIYEDRLALTKLYFFANKIVKISKPLYHYNRDNINSITAQKSEIHFTQAIKFWSSLEIFLISNNIYKTFQNSVEYSKIENKVMLMLQANSYQLKKKYASLFSDVEAKYIGLFPFKSQNMILFCIHHKMVLLGHFISILLKLKVKIKS